LVSRHPVVLDPEPLVLVGTPKVSVAHNRLNNNLRHTDFHRLAVVIKVCSLNKPCPQLPSNHPDTRMDTQLLLLLHATWVSLRATLFQWIPSLLFKHRQTTKDYLLASPLLVALQAKRTASLEDHPVFLLPMKVGSTASRVCRWILVSSWHQLHVIRFHESNRHSHFVAHESWCTILSLGHISLLTTSWEFSSLEIPSSVSGIDHHLRLVHFPQENINHLHILISTPRLIASFSYSGAITTQNLWSLRRSCHPTLRVDLSFGLLLCLHTWRTSHLPLKISNHDAFLGCTWDSHVTAIQTVHTIFNCPTRHTPQYYLTKRMVHTDWELQYGRVAELSFRFALGFLLWKMDIALVFPSALRLAFSSFQWVYEK